MFFFSCWLRIKVTKWFVIVVIVSVVEVMHTFMQQLILDMQCLGYFVFAVEYCQPVKLRQNAFLFIIVIIYFRLENIYAVFAFRCSS